MEKQLDHKVEVLNGINAFITRYMKDMIFSIYLPTYQSVCRYVFPFIFLSLRRELSIKAGREP